MVCFHSAQRVGDHFVDVTEMIEIGRVSRGCGGHQTVGCQRDFFKLAAEVGVEELQETGEAKQRVSASFGGEGDGGSPFEDVAVVVGELQEDFGVLHRHGLPGHTLRGSGRSAGQVDAETKSGFVLKDGVIRAGVEQTVIGS